MSFTVKINQIDMGDEMKEDALRLAKEAVTNFGKSGEEREIAKSIKAAFDEKYKEGWCCIAGVSFGSLVSHASKRFIYFTLQREEKDATTPPLGILLFKATS
eukprot:TRINITY_DN62647_c0_g1_i1.p1 TRINITY_DN62647_c0_g1~~TRINITY_DN62647_c0_g1_i1.p1  ORF type:complete len:102 (-),score=0.98 TRINITY_DN62647_c0_g1_i1:56-361(-)